MDEKTRYYKFVSGSVIVRRTGDKIEKKGKKECGKTPRIWPGAFPGTTIRLLK